MKSVKVDFNRTIQGDLLLVSLRRFEQQPRIGEEFLAEDEGMSYEGTVDSVDEIKKQVRLKVKWESPSADPGILIGSLWHASRAINRSTLTIAPGSELNVDLRKRTLQEA